MEKSEYEKLREANIRQREDLLKGLVSEMNDFVRKENITPKKPWSQKSKTETTPRRRRSLIHQYRFNPSYSLPQTRSRSRMGSVCSSSSVCSSTTSSPSSSPQRLIVKFPFHKRFNGFSDSEDSVDVFEDVDDVDYYPYDITSRSRTVSVVQRGMHKIVPPEDIRPSDLERVATSVSEKVYDACQGTTCHQCRQKTNDFKTICRADTCSGVRGQFCGPCLKNRYGEDATEALLDANWICPPCRGVCNCSICRKKQGRNCTGILIHEATSSGYKSVKEYLDSVLDD